MIFVENEITMAKLQTSDWISIITACITIGAIIWGFTFKFARLEERVDNLIRVVSNLTKVVDNLSNVVGSMKVGMDKNMPLIKYRLDSLETRTERVEKKKKP